MVGSKDTELPELVLGHIVVLASLAVIGFGQLVPGLLGLAIGLVYIGVLFKHYQWEGFKVWAKQAWTDAKLRAMASNLT